MLISLELFNMVQHNNVDINYKKIEFDNIISLRRIANEMLDFNGLNTHSFSERIIFCLSMTNRFFKITILRYHSKREHTHSNLTRKGTIKLTKSGEYSIVPVKINYRLIN